ncbi:MAG: prepilin-type N-terminal cleavage/methylation domain-containing protein [Gemmatimonadota bacterium]
MSRPLRRARNGAGFTLVELILVIVLLGILSTIAIGRFTKVRQKAQSSRAIAEIRTLMTEIDLFDTVNGHLPVTLGDIGRAGLSDPWGNPYRYLPFTGGTVPGGARKDKNLVPINTRYDLFSMGIDGKSVPALTAKASQDDIIRANDGTFIGLAADY